MKIEFFSCKQYELPYLQKLAQQNSLSCTFHTEALSLQSLAKIQECPVISCFANDKIDAAIISKLQKLNCQLITLRCAGFDNVDLEAAKNAGITVTNVPSYSPHSVAEFSVLLTLALMRQLPQVLDNMQQHNFCLTGLTGREIHGKTVAVIGTGNIGEIYANVMQAFGANVIAYDPLENCAQLHYVSLEELISTAAVISLHCPLNSKTNHMVNSNFLNKMRDDAYLINTARGGIVDSQAMLTALKHNSIAGYAADVYEFEAGLYFNNDATTQLKDELLKKLLQQKNALLTDHCAFLTYTALEQIASTTMDNCVSFVAGKGLKNKLDLPLQRETA